MKLKKFLITLLTVLMVVTCGTVNVFAKDQEITITLNSWDGKFSDGSTTKQVKASGKNLSELKLKREAFEGDFVPTKKGYIFDSWYTKSTGGTKVTQDTFVDKNTEVLYAHYIEAIVITLDGNGGKYGDKDSITVNAKNDGKLDEKVFKAEGDYAVTKTNSFFLGYKDGDGNDVSKNTIFEANTTIQAQWLSNKATLDLNYKISDVEQTDTTDVIKVDNKYYLVKPADDPSREGYEFIGWYKEPGCEIKDKIDFVDIPKQAGKKGYIVTSETTIYAGWESSIETVVASLSATSATYGFNSLPTVTVKTDDDVTTLTKDTDYTVAWYTKEGVATTPANAGEYYATVALTTAAQDKYQFIVDSDPATSTNLDFVVNKVQLTKPTLTTSELNYSGLAQSPTISSSYSEDTMSKTGDIDGTNANNYTLTISLKDTTNYEWKAAEASEYDTEDVVLNWKIKKANLTITAEDKTITINDDVPTYTVKYEGFVNSETKDVLNGTLDFDCDYTKESTGRSYTITPKGLTSNNYEISFVPGTLTVNKKSINVDIKIDNKKYDGKEITPVGHFDPKDKGKIVVELKKEEPKPKDVKKPPEPVVEFNYTFTWYKKNSEGTFDKINTNPKDVGIYKLVAEAEDDTRYGKAEKEVEITKADLKVIAENKEIDFGADVPTYTEKYEGFKNEETKAVLGGTLALDCEYKKDDDAGEYTITPSGLTSNNYNITFVNGKLNVKKINPAFTAPTAKSLTYNEKDQVLVNAGSSTEGTMMYALGVGKDGKDKPAKNSYVDSLDTIIGKDAKEYTVYYYVAGDKNHNDTEPASIKATIAKKTFKECPFEVVGTYTYDGKEQTPTLKFTPSDFSVTDKDYDIKFDKGVNHKNANDAIPFKVIFKGNFDGEYDLTFKIAKKKLTASWPEAKDCTYVYDGNTHSPEAKVETGIKDEKVVLEYAYRIDAFNTKFVSDRQKNANKYVARVSLKDDVAVNNNYVLDGQTGWTKFEITKKKLTVSWPKAKDCTWVYDGQTHAPLAKVETGVKDEKVVLEYAYSYDLMGATFNLAKPKDVFKYLVRADLKDKEAVNKNYELDGETAWTKFDITSRTITASWDQYSFVYDGDSHAPKLTFSNVVTGEEVIPAYTFEPNNDHKAQGSYVITGTLDSTKDVNKNYSFTEMKTLFNIVDNEESQGNITTASINNNDDIEKVNTTKVTEEDLAKILTIVNDVDKSEKKAIKDAFDLEKSIRIYTKVNQISEAGKKAFEEKGYTEDNAILFDLDLYASIDGEAKEYKLTETNAGYIEVTITLSEDEAKKIVGSNKNYNILLQHEVDGEIEYSTISNIKMVKHIDEEEVVTYSFTFKTNKFSSYALYSKNKPHHDYDVPKTGIDE